MLLLFAFGNERESERKGKFNVTMCAHTNMVKKTSKRTMAIGNFFLLLWLLFGRCCVYSTDVLLKNWSMIKGLMSE